MTKDLQEFLIQSQNAIDFLNSSEDVFQRIDDSWRNEFIRLLEKHGASHKFEKKDNDKFVRRIKKLLKFMKVYYNPDINAEIKALEKEQSVMREYAKGLSFEEKEQAFNEISDSVDRLRDAYDNYLSVKDDFKQTKFSMEKMLEHQLELQQEQLLEALSNKKVNSAIAPVEKCEKPNCKHKHVNDIKPLDITNEA